jgi:hypothetical protein
MGTKFRELQNEMLSVNHDMDGVYSQYVHPGFGNVDTPNVVVFEEAPSRGHFTNRPEDVGSMNIHEYINYFEGEGEYRDQLLNWPPYKDFLGPVFAEFGVSRDSLLDETYMTSVVKNPVEMGNKKSSYLRKAYREIWKPYVQQELEFLEPNIVITAGRPASRWISALLGVPSSDARSISISKEQWWGPSPFDASSSLIYTPHWGARSYDSNIKENWSEILDRIVDGLRDGGYSAGVPTQND